MQSWMMRPEEKSAVGCGGFVENHTGCTKGWSFGVRWQFLHSSVHGERKGNCCVIF